MFVLLLPAVKAVVFVTWVAQSSNPGLLRLLEHASRFFVAENPHSCGISVTLSVS